MSFERYKHFFEKLNHVRRLEANMPLNGHFVVLDVSSAKVVGQMGLAPNELPLDVRENESREEAVKRVLATMVVKS
ncbi:hypothetical protein KBD45_07860 [Candidatus Dojkabacteria bacterium]|nr:hypothetical protein [Candidatus Dojkabacteria bacterium]